MISFYMYTLQVVSERIQLLLPAIEVSGNAEGNWNLILTLNVTAGFFPIPVFIVAFHSYH